MNYEIDPKEFWENKILDWEESRYSLSAGDVTEKVAGWASTSLRFRLRAAMTLLAPFVAGRPIVELGCGSGLLAQPLLARGASSYLGIDISERAVAAARQRVAALPNAAKIKFEAAAVEDLADLGPAIVLSLGLFDWLTPAQIDRVFSIGRNGSYFHAVAERRRSLQQFIHKIYVHLSYGHRTGGYVPQYHSIDQTRSAVERAGLRDFHVYRDDRMRFGIFVTDLPIPTARIKDNAPL